MLYERFIFSESSFYIYDLSRKSVQHKIALKNLSNHHDAAYVSARRTLETVKPNTTEGLIEMNTRKNGIRGAIRITGTDVAQDSED